MEYCAISVILEWILGGRLTAGLRPLEAAMMVRIHPPQPVENISASRFRFSLILSSARLSEGDEILSLVKRTWANMKDLSMYFVYILQCHDKSLYTGITNDLDRRLKRHKSGEGGSYTRAKRAVRIVYSEERPNRSSASKREAQIKGWTRKKKLELILITYPYGQSRQ